MGKVEAEAGSTIGDRPASQKRGRDKKGQEG
jgi:hypothetical protein